MDFITKKAYAKINLTLDVLEKLPNGYHELIMIMQQISMHDIITVSKTSECGISLNCNKNVSDLKDNLAYKAGELMAQTYNIKSGIKIDVEKNIFVAGGLAGGSTDAGTTMLCINELFELNRPLDELMTLGQKLGSDIPFCMHGKLALATGTGTHIETLPSYDKTYVVVANPMIEVSTKEVFESFVFENQKKSDYKTILNAINNNNVDEIAKNFNNMLESVTIQKNPIIGLIKNTMLENGAMGCLMSGSGASVFGYYKDEAHAKHALQILNDTFGTIKAEVCYTL